MKKNLIVIPARLKSTRLPRKILLDLDGKTVIERVFDAASKSLKQDKIIIAVDDEETLTECLKFTSNVMMTQNTHDSGTMRIKEVISTYSEYINIVNVQGDEPLINHQLIDDLFQELENNNTVVSAYYNINKADAEDINNVKVVLNNNSEALYFSRSLIPYDRENQYPDLKYKQHIGIYGYKKELFNKMENFVHTDLENIEKLEQLKILFNDIPIKMVYTQDKPIGIDTLEDYKKVKKIFLEKKNEI